MNENLFASFITPTIIGLPIVVTIIMFPSILFPSSKRLISNRLHSFQHWLIKLIIKQIMLIHTPKGRTWALIIVYLIIFIGSTNLLGLLPHTFTPTTQLSINLSIAIPLWAGAVILGFRHKLKKFFSPLLTARNPHLTNSHTNHHRNYQPIYSTDSTSSTTNSKHYSRPSINASNRRSYSSTYRHQPTNRYNYIYYSTSTYSTWICRSLNSSLCIHPSSKPVPTW